ncbi:hypothetical protein BB561_004981 [Smittium simulii]|uniref:AAA+ ATPase domain-containing protein n=1 Tax=Smittium simulii TaxID=133385 RepID=A0A2T9YD18_9FUNG|nr:hypothetical protein BB561_004981 [Smittium simulii]
MTATKTDDQLPWIEKYRPKNISDIVSQDRVVNVLQSSIEKKGLPHLLFYGPPGTGKTSTILAFSHQLFGSELVSSRVLELNASDERGIQVVRNKVKNFAQALVSNSKLNASCPPYKIIILDEADSMTVDAQAALRRIMEDYSKNTRFCLICNYVSRIIEPLASRCAKFRFESLDPKQINSLLKNIADKESVNIEPKEIDSLIAASNGDLRKATMFLQSAHNFYKNDKIDSLAIDYICGITPENEIQSLLDASVSKSIDRIRNQVFQSIKNGNSAKQILYQVHKKVIENNINSNFILSSEQKSNISIAIASIEHALNTGADEELQLLSLFTSISNTF